MSNIKNKLVNGAIRLVIVGCVAWAWVAHDRHNSIVPLYHKATIPSRGFFSLSGKSYFIDHEVDGVKYSRGFTRDTWRWIQQKYNPGDSLNIKYNPEDPYKFYPSDAPDVFERMVMDYWMSKLLFVFFGGIFMFYAIAVPYPWHLRKRFKEWLDNL